MTAKDLLKRVPAAVREGETAPDAIVQYELSEPMYHVLEGGSVRVVEGRAERPNVTITVSDDNLVKLFRGEMNPMTAFMTGKVKLKGDMMLAQKLLSIVDRDKLEP